MVGVKGIGEVNDYFNFFILLNLVLTELQDTLKKF